MHLFYRVFNNKTSSNAPLTQPYYSYHKGNSHKNAVTSASENIVTSDSENIITSAPENIVTSAPWNIVVSAPWNIVTSAPRILWQCSWEYCGKCSLVHSDIFLWPLWQGVLRVLWQVLLRNTDRFPENICGKCFLEHCGRCSWEHCDTCSWGHYNSWWEHCKNCSQIAQRGD